MCWDTCGLVDILMVVIYVSCYDIHVVVISVSCVGIRVPCLYNGGGDFCIVCWNNYDGFV